MALHAAGCSSPWSVTSLRTQATSVDTPNPTLTLPLTLTIPTQPNRHMPAVTNPRWKKVTRNTLHHLYNISTLRVFASPTRHAAIPPSQVTPYDDGALEACPPKNPTVPHLDVQGLVRHLHQHRPLDLPRHQQLVSEQPRAHHAPCNNIEPADGTCCHC